MSQPTSPDATPETSPDATPTGPDLPPEDENRLLRRELDTARGRIEALEAQVLRGPRVSQADVQSSLAISALVELHRVTTSGPGIRGGGNTRYLDAARRLGDELADAILGPSESPAQV